MRNILITGANRGIGLEFVRQLADGFSPSTTQIFATCRKPQDAKDLLEIKAKSQKIQIHIIPLDITDNANIQSSVNLVEKIVGDEGLNVLVNNAGYLDRTNVAKLPTIDPDAMAKHFEINATGPILVSQAYLPLLKKVTAKDNVKKSCSNSAIISISTTLGSISSSNVKLMFPMVPYKMSKAALNMGFKILANEIKDENILVTLLDPGWVKTDMGGPQAMLTAKDSVFSMLKTMATLNETHHGSYMNKDGKTIPW